MALHFCRHLNHLFGFIENIPIDTCFFLTERWLRKIQTDKHDLWTNKRLDFSVISLLA